MTDSHETLDPGQIGKRIRSLRGGMNQEEFATAIGCDQSHISKLEKGQKLPSLQLLVRLAEWSGRSLSWIITGQEEKPSSRVRREKEPPLVISRKDSPELYQLLVLLKSSRPKEIRRFVKMALAYFEEEKKGR